jgi:hypothetical protein
MHQRQKYAEEEGKLFHVSMLRIFEENLVAVVWCFREIPHHPDSYICQIEGLL